MRAREFAACERESIKARLSRDRRVRREVEEQMQRVRAVHEERLARAELEAEMEEIKRRLTEIDTIENANTCSQISSEEAAERVAAAMVDALDAQFVDDANAHLLVLVWSDHNSAWSNLERLVKSKCVGSDNDSLLIRINDIPWPPAEGSVLAQMAVLERWSDRSDIANRSKAASTAYRRAFRKASLRWHPDKFSAKFGRHLHPDDADEITMRVQNVSQSINDEWNELNTHQPCCA